MAFIDDDTFTKNTHGRAAEWEVAGLNWLRDAESSGGARVVKVFGQDDSVPGGGLVLERLDNGRASTRFAREFGAALSHTHEAGAAAFGAGPDGWEGDGLHGPNDELMPLSLKHYDHWGEMYAEARIMPTLERINSSQRGATLGEQGNKAVEAVCERLRDGDFDDIDTPARIHGDLWAGNVMWTSSGAVLIDPSAHGGHPLTDLAALALFGAPKLDAIYEGYESEGFLNKGCRKLIPLHQLSMLLSHVYLFGSSYVPSTVQAASQYA